MDTTTRPTPTIRGRRPYRRNPLILHADPVGVGDGRIAPEERIVVRRARPDEMETVRRLAQAHPTGPRFGDAPVGLAVVAIVDGTVIGAAAATVEDGDFRSYVTVAPDWLGIGLGRFLGRALARELLTLVDEPGAASA